MTLVEYLGLDLKDDAVLELLERYDIEVIYRFDRLHENTPDEYTAAARGAGFELCFDEQQVLQTIFCYAAPRDGFAAVDPAIVGAPFFKTPADAKTAAAQGGSDLQYNDGMEFLGRRLSWVSFELGEHKRHYEYSPKTLSLVTLSLAKPG